MDYGRFPSFHDFFPSTLSWLVKLCFYRILLFWTSLDSLTIVSLHKRSVHYWWLFASQSSLRCCFILRTKQDFPHRWSHLSRKMLHKISKNYRLELVMKTTSAIELDSNWICKSCKRISVSAPKYRRGSRLENKRKKKNNSSPEDVEANFIWSEMQATTKSERVEKNELKFQLQQLCQFRCYCQKKLCLIQFDA